MNAMRSAIMPSGFDKASVKTRKNNECLSHMSLQGVTPSSLIS